MGAAGVRLRQALTQCLWYTRDKHEGQNVPIQERDLTGYMRGVWRFDREDQGTGAQLPKLMLLVHADRDYVIQSGLETNFHKVIALLTDPERFGGNAEDAFDVVAPSLPGYGFSGRPTTRGVNAQAVADLFAQLMTRTLGYRAFAAHGGDLGRGVTEQLARRHPDALVAIHLTDLPFRYLQGLPQDTLSDAERRYLEAVQAWGAQEGAYAAMQATKPQTLAYGLNDSPARLAGWLVEKFRTWSDCGGEVERRFSKDELLTNITLYWATETVGSSFLPYFETRQTSADAPPNRVEVPTGVALFPKDLTSAPREFGERFFDVRRWTEMPRGGHFAALEEPELLVAELREFFRPYRAES